MLIVYSYVGPPIRGLRRLKAEVARRWGAVPLVDMLKEAVLRTGCLDALTTRTGRAGGISPEALAERLVLVIYGYGTNTGLRAVAAGRHGHTEDDLRYVRRRHLSLESAREIAVRIADATFAARREAIWGRGRARSRRTPPTSRRWIRTCSPSGTPATAGAGC